MTAEHRNLPDFSKPPVIEVLLGLQVDPISNLRIVNYGDVYSLFKGEFPRVQELPPIPPAFETFGPNPSIGLEARIELVQSVNPRLWFISADDTRLLQIQQDRFIHNWRQADSPDGYPRYERIRDDFQRHWAAYQTYLATIGGELKINQCEITYVNHIQLPDDQEVWANPHRVFARWRKPEERQEATGVPEDVRFMMRWVYRRPTNEPFARLHCSVEPALTKRNAKILLMKLIFRGRPEKPSISSALEFFATGREAIVKAFAELTTSEMHEHWGRKQ